MNTATRFRRLLKQALSFAVAFGIWFVADTRRADERELASLCRICGRYLLRHSERISAPDGLAAGGIGRGADSHR